MATYDAGKSPPGMRTICQHLKLGKHPTPATPSLSTIHKVVTNDPKHLTHELVSYESERTTNHVLKTQDLKNCHCTCLPY